MSIPIEQISELQRLERTPPAPRGARRQRRILRRLRLSWIAISSAATVVLAVQAFTGPANIRIAMGLLSAVSLLLLLFLVREEKYQRVSKLQARFLWHRLRDLSQIFEVVLGMRSEEDVRHLSGLGLQESMLLLRCELGALVFHMAGEEDHVTLLGFEDSELDHRPWLMEVQGLLKGLHVNVPVFVPDVDEDPHFSKATVMRKAGFASFAAINFGTGDQVSGMILLGNPAPCEFRHGDDKTLELCARQLGAIVRHGQTLDAFEDRIEELKRENDELTYSGQLKSEFASVASHELKTPLTAVKASVDALLSNVRRHDYRDIEELLLVIREEADRLLEMTGKILEISGLDSTGRVMERRPVRLRRVVESCAQALEVHLQEKDMNLVTDLPVDLPEVFADPGTIRQVLINLLGNAIKFSTSGLTVTVRAEHRGDQVEVEVVDQGPGIPPEEQPHIFERFYQGSRQADIHVQGSGLGLAIVKQLVEQHQGQISVWSEPGKGARFRFQLPVARDRFGLEGSALDLQPQGEVEEFLRLAVDWLCYVVNPSCTHLLLGKDDGLVHYHASAECGVHEQALEVATGAYELDAPTLSGNRGEDGAEGEPTYIAVPLKFEGEAVGCFVLGREEIPYRQEDLLLVEGIVGRIGRVLEHAVGQKDSGRVLRRAMRAVRDLLQSGSRSTPRLDPGVLAWELAMRAGASKELGRDMRMAINFHDVAMAQIGAEIENQERRLSDEEMAKLRRHPGMAARLLEDIQAMEEVSRIVLHHHEWFDGSGYPQGLASEDIPLGARVVAVIDAFCSMTAPRKYKPVLGTLAAARELVRYSGTQFDPQLVTHFVGVLRDKSWIESSEAEELLRNHAVEAAEKVRHTAHPSVLAMSADNHDEDEGI